MKRRISITAVHCLWRCKSLLVTLTPASGAIYYRRRQASDIARFENVKEKFTIVMRAYLAESLCRLYQA